MRNFPPKHTPPMKKLLPLLMLSLLACQPKAPQVLYQSEAFTLYPDRVVQGKYEAKAVSDHEITSNYQSPTSENFSREVVFKVSINEKDNEAPSGQDHWLLIGEEHESPMITFGEEPAPRPTGEAGFLPVNYAYIFRVDMRPVLQQFKEKGYYQAFDGSRVAKGDFKGFYLAGSADPLSWDWVNLHNKGLQLQDPDGDGIYTLDVIFNPYDENSHTLRTWKLEKDLSSKAHYHSDQPIVDALFNLSLEEALKNIEPDSTFRTGAKWGGVWTRDISYSIVLAFGFHEPEVAKISLMKKVKRDRIIQDTGSGGAWPVSSDRTTWALAAWEIYQTTGDTAWLRQAYTIVKNTLDDDFQVIRDAQTGLYSGESSFLDWREQTYPKWMSNMDIYVSENLGTNVVHATAHQLLANMAQELGLPGEVYAQRAATLRQGINDQLWQPEKGYYAQYRYGRSNLISSPRFEALGEALAVLFDVANEKQATAIFEKSPVTAYGTTCIYPQIPGIPPYHNNGIWPFVQSFWNLAAGRAGNEDALNHGLAAIYRAGGLFLTNYENFVAQNGDFEGTEINSDRMLWSMAGNLAMVHRVFMGMHFGGEGIHFSPMIPSGYTGTKTLTNFHYRDAVLDITVKGTGNKIVSITLDGQPLENATFPANLDGKHAIEIVMDNKPFHQGGIHLVPNHFSLPDPQVKAENGSLVWAPVKGAVKYQVLKNGKQVAETSETRYAVTVGNFAEYQVIAVDDQGWGSFASEPLILVSPDEVLQVEMETVAPKSGFKAVNFSGKGFVEISNTLNRSMDFSINVPEAGAWLLDFRYANGSGPWNTDNKCALRSLYVQDAYVGTMVFPQRGTDEWSDWGWSNSRMVNLAKGENKVSLTFAPWNVNMNVDVNTALLDYVRVIRIQE